MSLFSQSHPCIPSRWSSIVCLGCSRPRIARLLKEAFSDYVHSFVGHEPSGRLFNGICLDPNVKPHNPMINSGAIIVTSLLKKGVPMADRYDFALNEYKKLAGGGYVGFNNATFLSEKKTADRNYALSYMKENKCFPPDCATLREELDFYFQLCSLETHCTAAVMAATMANGDPHKVFTTPHPLVNAQQHNHQQRQSQFPYDGKRHFSNGFHAAPAKLGHKTVQAIDDHQLANELAAPGLQMICAPDCEPKAFVILIDFVYSDFDVRSLSVRGQLTDDNVMNALYAAKKYAIDAHGFWANSRSKHTVQAFNYAIVASDLGESGRLFNEICLDPNGKPHNPMINSGAIIVTSLLKKGVPMADRYDFSGSGRTRRLLLEEVGAMSVESPLTRRVQAVQTPHRLATR